MVNLNELRIGNRVISGRHNILNATIDGIMPNGLILLKEVTTYEINDELGIQPIPLTPEILEKCGFEKTGSTNFENNKHIISFLVKQYDDNSILLAVENEYETCKIGIYKHVHQLQNVYHAITGTELEINLT